MQSSNHIFQLQCRTVMTSLRSIQSSIDVKFGESLAVQRTIPLFMVVDCKTILKKVVMVVFGFGETILRTLECGQGQPLDYSF
jgi:hypothetical protein